MRDSSAKILSVLVRVLPYVFLIASIATFLFLLILGRSDIALKSLYLLLPISIASLIIIIRPRWFSRESITPSPLVSLSAGSFRNLVLLSVLLYIISISVLIAYNGSTLFYFIVIGLIASLIFVQILVHGEEHPGRKNVILAQIVFLAANVILGQTLRLPLFFGYGDVLAHMYNINTIVETGRVTSTMLVDYEYFPALHIFGAAGNMLSGLDLETSYFVFNNLIFLISIPVVYLLVSRITKNAYLPLTAALLYTLSREVLFNGMYMITRVMAFVLCLLILYLLIRSRTNFKLRAMAVFLVFPLVVVHHTTLIHFSAILFIIVIIEYFLYRRRRYIGFNFLALFTLAYLGYWVWISYPFFESTLISYTASTELTQVPLADTERSLFLTFTNNADAIVIALLAVFGIIILLRAGQESINMGTTFALFSIVSLVIYFPVVASFLSRAFLSARMQLLVTPFIAFVAAGGLLLIAGKGSPMRTYGVWAARAAIGMFIVFFLSLSSTVILANSTDLNLNKVLGNENRQYFINSELSAFSFAQEYGPDILYYGDYESSVYLRQRLGLRVRQTADIFEPGTIERGCLIFRREELNTRGQLGFAIWSEEGSPDWNYVYRDGQNSDLQTSWELENKIFDNGTLYMYMKRTS